VAVLSMSKQGFGRLDVLLRVLSGRLRRFRTCSTVSLKLRLRSILCTLV